MMMKHVSQIARAFLIFTIIAGIAGCDIFDEASSPSTQSSIDAATSDEEGGLETLSACEPSCESSAAQLARAAAREGGLAPEYSSPALPGSCGHLVKCSLTVFLGGAGMGGEYIDHMVIALKKAGVQNPVAGSYHALGNEETNKLITTGFDAPSVLWFNDDPLIDNRGGEFAHLNLFAMMDAARYRYFDKLTLKDIQISGSVPKSGQFNLIGYSWGAVTAARVAVDLARAGEKVDHLVLIGAPIEPSLLKASKHPNIKRTIIIDLTLFGDPIYAGMSDVEIIATSPYLAEQMLEGSGHFYYAGHKLGFTRREALASQLFEEGLR